MPFGKMNFGKCYRKVGRLAYLNKQEKPNQTKDYASEDARTRAIRRRVGRFSTNADKKNYGPLFGLKKTLFDNSCNGKNKVYYTANSGDASDVTFWRKNYVGSKNLTVSGKNCNTTACGECETLKTYGKVVVDFGGTLESALCSQLDSNGNMYVAGFSNARNGDSEDFAIAKLNPDGTLANDFGKDGKVLVHFGDKNSRGYSLQLDDDGNIYIAGNVSVGKINSQELDPNMAIVKLNPDGTLATDFGNDGKVLVNFGENSNSQARSLQLDDIGNIYVVGGAVVRSGTQVTIVKLNRDGSLTTNFGNDGKVIIDIQLSFALSVQLDDVGNIYIAGWKLFDSFLVIKLNPDGTLANDFGNDGKVFVPFGSTQSIGLSLQLDGNGNIYVAGVDENISQFGMVEYSNMAIVKLNTNGTLATDFGNDGKVLVNFGENSNTSAHGLQLDDNGNIYVGGREGAPIYDGSSGIRNIAIAKLNPNGTLANDFGNDGKVIVHFGENEDSWGQSLQLDGDGNIYVAGGRRVAGTDDFAIIKLKHDGSLS